MEPELKVPGTHFLTLTYDEPLSSLAVKFNWRPYTMVQCNSCGRTWQMMLATSYVAI
jgi:hypothetical protein